MLQIVISNKCKKDLKRAKKRGLDLDEFFAVVDMLQRQEALLMASMVAGRGGAQKCLLS